MIMLRNLVFVFIQVYIDIVIKKIPKNRRDIASDRFDFWKQNKYQPCMQNESFAYAFLQVICSLN